MIENSKMLAEWRHKLRLSQIRLAQECKVSRFKIYQFENGYIQLTKPEIEKIESALRNITKQLGLDLRKVEIKARG